MIIVYVTCKDSAEAQKIGEMAVQKKLAACANHFSSQSCYQWKGKLVNDKEAILLLKTKDSSYDGLRAMIEEVHSYDIPCILRIDVQANKAYEDWVEESTR